MSGPATAVLIVLTAWAVLSLPAAMLIGAYLRRLGQLDSRAAADAGDAPP